MKGRQSADMVVRMIREGFQKMFNESDRLSAEIRKHLKELETELKKGGIEPEEETVKAKEMKFPLRPIKALEREWDDEV